MTSWMTLLGMMVLAAPLPQELERPPSLTVSAEGRVDAEPDHAFLVLGVRTTARSAARAMEDNAERAREVIRSLKEAGIPASEIRTRTVRLEPLREDEPDAPLTFAASNEVEAVVRELPKLGSMIDQAVRAGANVVRELSLRVSGRDRLLQEARVDAMRQARDTATQLAELAGARLGPVLSVSESHGGDRPFTARAVEQSAVPVEPGIRTIGLTVHVTWILVPR